jgi:hypothetical protein
MVDCRRNLVGICVVVEEIEWTRDDLIGHEHSLSDVIRYMLNEDRTENVPRGLYLKVKLTYGA